MQRSKKGSGLATAPSSLRKKNAWKKFVVLTVNPLDDDVVISDIKARNTNEAYEILEAGSHNFDRDILFSETGFENLLKAIQSMPGKKFIDVEKFDESRGMILIALADYRCWWTDEEEIDKEKREQIDKAIAVINDIA